MHIAPGSWDCSGTAWTWPGAAGWSHQTCSTPVGWRMSRKGSRGARKGLDIPAAACGFAPGAGGALTQLSETAALDSNNHSTPGKQLPVESGSDLVRLPGGFVAPVARSRGCAAEANRTH